MRREASRATTQPEADRHGDKFGESCSLETTGLLIRRPLAESPSDEMTFYIAASGRRKRRRVKPDDAVIVRQLPDTGLLNQVKPEAHEVLCDANRMLRDFPEGAVDKLPIRPMRWFSDCGKYLYIMRGWITWTGQRCLRVQYHRRERTHDGKTWRLGQRGVCIETRNGRPTRS